MNDQAQNWKEIVNDMRQALAEVEQGHRELQDALTVSPREMRLALTIALIVLSDRRRAKSIAARVGESETYLRTHLQPILKEVLDNHVEADQDTP